mgnify:CR=1 FL=1
MDMKVRDALADAVVDPDEAAIGRERFFDGRSQDTRGGEQRRDAVGGQVGQRLEVRAGDEQAVAGKEGPGVEKREDVFSFVNFGCGQGSVGDPAKNARCEGHGIHHAPAAGSGSLPAVAVRCEGARGSF